MLVYWGILIWVFAIGYMQPSMTSPIEVNGALEYRSKWGFALLLLSVPVFFAAVRSGCIDTASYIREFNNVPTDMQYFDEYLQGHSDSQLFYGLQMIFKCYISQDAHWWLALIAVVQGLCVASTLKKYSPNIAMSVYIFIASTLIFSWMYNGMRQFIAVSILFACTDWILKKRWYFYLPVAVLLCGLDPICTRFGMETPVWFLQGFHQSGIIMIPIFFFVQGKAWNKKIWLLVAVLLALIFTGTLGTAVESATESTTYSVDIANMQADSGANPIRTVVALVPVVMAFMKRKEMGKDEVPPIIHLCINMAIVAACLYAASMVTSGMYVGRLPIYCELYNLILIPWLIAHPYQKNSKLLTQAVYGCYLLYFIYQMYFSWDGLEYSSDVLNLYLR